MTLAFQMAFLQLVAFQGAVAVATHISPQSVVESHHSGVAPEDEWHGNVNAQMDGSARIHFVKSAEPNLQLSELQASLDKRLVRSAHFQAPLQPLDADTPLRVNANGTTWSDNMRLWIGSAVAHSKVLRLSAPLLPVVITWATRMSGAWSPVSLAAVGVVSVVSLGCAWSEKDQELWIQKILVGSMAGGFLALTMTATASFVMCCGMCLDSVKTNTKKFGAFIVFFAVLAMIIPFMASQGACSTVDDEVCAECAKVTSVGEPCTPQTKKDIEDSCNALGFLVVYVAAYGWVAVIFGNIAACMGCCAICGCNNCKLGEANNPNGPNGQQRLVGQPVEGQGQYPYS